MRTSFDRFLIVPGHEIEEVDEVVERHASYLVEFVPGRDRVLVGPKGFEGPLNVEAALRGDPAMIDFRR